VPTKDSEVSIRVVSDIKGLLQIEHQWNALVNNSSKNPFLLSEFAKQFIECNTKGWTPMILVISDNHTILGVAPLVKRKSLLGYRVKFFHPPWCSEFIFEKQHMSTCIKVTLSFLFNTLKCKFASFSLPRSSPNLPLLIEQCKLEEIHLKTAPEMDHRIIPITSTWTEFEALQTRKFRREIQRVERNLSKLGPWKTMRVGGNEESDMTDKILNVEKKSWKETWRSQRGETDWVLMLVLSAAQRLAKIEPNFEWSTWFLTLKGKPISYILVIEYGEVAYLVKTSYDERYREYYPGIIIQNAAIKELFVNGQDKNIDFLSDLPYLETWTDKCLPQVKVQLTKGLVPTIIQFMFENTFVKKILSILFWLRNPRTPFKKAPEFKPL